MVGAFCDPFFISKKEYYFMLAESMKMKAQDTEILGRKDLIACCRNWSIFVVLNYWLFPYSINPSPFLVFVVHLSVIALVSLICVLFPPFFYYQEFVVHLSNSWSKMLKLLVKSIPIYLLSRWLSQP